MDLPTEFTGQIHFYYSVKYDFMTVSEYERDDRAEYIYLGSPDELHVDFSVSREDAVKQMVNSLREEKKSVQAKAEKSLRDLDKQINDLLAITYDGGSDED